MRCFVAIELPEQVKRSLARLQEEFAHLGRAVRWVRPEAMHLTLKFLGEVPDNRLTAICQAVTNAASVCEPFEFAVRSAGCFPPRGGVRVVWAGVDEPTGLLADCQQRCEEAFAELGFDKESRPYVPHLTLGRVKDVRRTGNLREGVADRADFEAGIVSVEQLVLFESRLSPQGAQYTPLHHATLSPS